LTAIGRGDLADLVGRYYDGDLRTGVGTHVRRFQCAPEEETKMRDSRDYKLFPNDLNLLGAYRALFAHFDECKYAEGENCDKIGFYVHVDGDRVLSGQRVAEFLKVLGRFPRASDMTTHFHWERSKAETFGVGVDISKRKISIWIESEDLNTIAAIHDKAREFFDVKNPVPERSPELSKYSLKKTVFLAHRFDESGRMAASAVATFLGRLGFQVSEGEGYESKDIPEKVSSRIRAQDIFVCVVTEGDPSWLLSEAAFAKALHRYVVILVQQEVTFNKGILGGDFEHISFPAGIVEKSFSELLYALPV
jgi:hypothetical protein